MSMFSQFGYTLHTSDRHCLRSLIRIRYYTDYHEKFPLLPPKKVFMQDPCSNRLLFRTVIAIASRAFRKNQKPEQDLCIRLLPAMKRLIAEQTLTLRPSLPSIQALLILCCWPLPYDTIGHPYWMYCGIATHQALLRGLHRPQHFPEYEYGLVATEDAVNARVRTWVVCFIINQKCVLRPKERAAC